MVPSAVKIPVVEKHATLSKDETYRYRLLRRWGSGPLLTFIMLNPSTADARFDDPTIRRCMGFAHTQGLDGIRVLNLYAFRATDPRNLWTAKDPIGPLNDAYLIRAMEAADRHEVPVVAAWGVNAKPERVKRVLSLVPHVMSCLGTTQKGHPRHPLYVRGDTLLRPYAVRN